MSKLNEKELLGEFEYFTKNISKRITSDKHSPLNKHGRACEQIVALIKIFCAKEISAGPIKKDISQSDLIKWLQGINQAATAMKDYYVMKATTQLIEMIQKPGVTEEWYEEKAKEILKLIGYKIHGEYLNVHIGEAKVFIRSLVEKIKQKKPRVGAEFVENWTDKFDGIAQQSLIIDIDLIKQMLKEAGVEVVGK